MSSTSACLHGVAAARVLRGHCQCQPFNQSLHWRQSYVGSSWTGPMFSRTRQSTYDDRRGGATVCTANTCPPEALHIRQMAHAHVAAYPSAPRRGFASVPASVGCRSRACAFPAVGETCDDIDEATAINLSLAAHPSAGRTRIARSYCVRCVRSRADRRWLCARSCKM